MKLAEFPNSVDQGEVAHNEPPHLDLHCLLSILYFLKSQYNIAKIKYFLSSVVINLVICCFEVLKIN